MVNQLAGKKVQGRKKGSLWDLYSHIIEGRILCKPDGTKGVVCCFKYHDYSMKYAAVYQVRWEHSRTSVDVPARLVEEWCTDVFANETWVPKKIRAAQLANWHSDKVEQYMDSPLLKVHQGRRQPESDAQPAPPNKKAKSNTYGVQHSIFVSPPKAGRPRDLASELQQATQAHMEAASRRNCRSVHQSELEHNSTEAADGGHRVGGEQGEGFLGQLKNVCSRLIGAGGAGGADASNSTGASPPSPPDIAPVPGKNAAAGAATQSPAAAAVQMGPATTPGAQGPAAKADNSGNSSKAHGARRGKAKAGTQADGGEDGKERIAKDGEEWVSSWTGKVYPRSVCYRPGDKLIQELTMDDLVGDYEVERIVDEFVTNKSKWYLIKYKGYELRLGNGENDKGDWELQKNVKGTEAYRQWQRSKPAYFFQLIGDQAKLSK